MRRASRRTARHAATGNSQRKEQQVGMLHERLASSNDDVCLAATPVERPGSVYRRRFTTVNRLVPAPHLAKGMGAAVPIATVAAAFAILVLSTACATSPLATPGTYPVAMRYDVEPEFIDTTSAAAFNTIERDLQAIARMGFDHVLLHHVDDRDRSALLALADTCGLAAALPDRALTHYVKTGALSPDRGNIKSLVRSIPRSLTDNRAFWALAVDSGGNSETRQRCQAVCKALQDHNIRCIPIDTGQSVAEEAGGDTKHPVIITARLDTLRPKESLSQHWFFELHRGFSASFVGGLVVDRYRGAASGERSLVIGDEPPSVAVLAAIDGVTSRARHWGPKLQGMRACSVPLTGDEPEDLLATVFVRERRRYVLVFNRSTTDYFRESVVLPGEIGGASARRAVEVPPTTDRVPGRVFDASQGRLSVMVDLRPGEAALFEVF